MPFWTFFIATALGRQCQLPIRPLRTPASAVHPGKGVVKVNGQAVVFVNLFGSTAFQAGSLAG